MNDAKGGPELCRPGLRSGTVGPEGQARIPGPTFAPAIPIRFLLVKHNLFRQADDSIGRGDRARINEGG